MKWNAGLKNNEAVNYSLVLNNHVLVTKPKKVVYDYHYVVPWELIEDNKITVNLKFKDDD